MHRNGLRAPPGSSPACEGTGGQVGRSSALPSASVREGRGSGERRPDCTGFPEVWGLSADWQDPEFMRDVEAATGVDLGASRASGRGKGKRKKHPGLTDLKRQADTARARISKKVFAK